VQICSMGFFIQSLTADTSAQWLKSVLLLLNSNDKDDRLAVPQHTPAQLTAELLPCLSQERNNVCGDLFGSGFVSACLYSLATLFSDAGFLIGQTYMTYTSSWFYFFGAMTYVVNALVDVAVSLQLCWIFTARSTVKRETVAPQHSLAIHPSPCAEEVATTSGKCFTGITEVLPTRKSPQLEDDVSRLRDKLDWDSWTAFVFLLGSLALMVSSILNQPINSSGPMDLAASTFSWAAIVLYIVNSLVGVRATWQRRLQAAPHDQLFVVFVWSAGAPANVDWRAWGDFIFMSAAFCDLYNQILPAHACFELSPLLWSFSAVCYTCGSAYLMKKLQSPEQ